MRSDQEIYNDIGSILLCAAPEKASKIMMRAMLSSENDHCKCEFDYVGNHTGDINWFSAGAQSNGEIFDLIVELRNYFIENFKSQGKPL
jgi:hypothetical protein